MTSEILFQENTEIDSIQQMITTIHNHIAEYRSNLSRRPNVYRPKIAELQANLAQIYWYDYKDYHSAEKLFLQALENYEKYSGRRIIIQSHKLKIMDFLVNLYNRSNRLELSEQILLRMLEIQKRLAENYWWIYLEDVAITQWRLGNLYVDMRRFNSAERLYSASLDTRSEFDREDIYRYRPATAQCQRSLGKLYEVHLKNYPKAEQCYRKSIEILQELCENEYERCNFIRSLQHSQLLLAHLHSDTSSEQDRPANKNSAFYDAGKSYDRISVIYRPSNFQCSDRLSVITVLSAQILNNPWQRAISFGSPVCLPSTSESFTTGQNSFPP